MATLPQLIDVLAKHDGRDHATLTQFGRVIREAGFLPKGKRGMGAPRMTGEHAVCLLLGIFCSNSPKDAPDTITRLSSLTLYDTTTDENTPEDLAEIGKAETFAEALQEAIVSSLGIVSSMNAFVGLQKPDMSEESQRNVARMNLAGTGPLNFRVSIRALSAKMMLTSPWGKVHWSAEYIVDTDLFMDGFYPDPAKFDRKVTVEFGLPTLTDLFLRLIDADLGYDGEDTAP